MPNMKRAKVKVTKNENVKLVLRRSSWKVDRFTSNRYPNDKMSSNTLH